MKQEGGQPLVVGRLLEVVQVVEGEETSVAELECEVE